eukprot:TRINITY_DN14601_c0_g1_i1.p1 TRINITY_DN14601_c0_g1~~TRINITY_DN14601_c0_g1_i1.p1  ORF type:complete len:239 (+),score=63.13 TRINITY_DN14601_c0_g1_i1:62-778(+)
MTTLIFGTAGIGAALARRLAQKGQSVHIIGRNVAALESLRHENPLETTVCDCSDPEAVSSTVKQIVQSNPIKGLVYAVGTIPLKPFKMTTPADFLDAFKVNVLGATTALQAALPSMTDGSSVVLFSTVAVQQGFPMHAAISAAKGGIEGLTRSLAAELSPKIRVNCIAPSLTATPLASKFTKNPTTAKTLADAHPIPRLGSADEMAALADFLLDGESAGWITGQIIGVDGGRSSLRTK